MTSTIGVKKIQHPNGTQVMTFDTAGKISSDVSSTGNITTTGTVNTPSINSGQIGGRRNIVINGAMQVAQRATSSTSISTSGYYTVDRFQIFMGNTDGRVTASQVADVHDGFANALKLECTTADTSIASNEFLGIQTKIEGQDVQQFKKGSSDAESITVSFYVKGDASATFAVELFDNDNSRQASQLFNVTTDWTRVTKTFAPDTTGAFDDNNEASLLLAFWLHGGSNFTSGTLSSTFVSSNNVNRAAGISSFLDSTNRTFFITGVQVEVGSQATPFEHRSYGDELYLCQRYFEVSGTSSDNPGGWAFKNMFVGVCHLGSYIQGQQFKVEKRADATIVVYSRSGTSGKVSFFDTGSNEGNNHSTNVSGRVGFHAVVRDSGSYTTGKGYEYGYTADAEL